MNGDILTGRTIAGYHLTRYVGEGGTATVYRAEHPERGLAAVKLLRARLAQDPVAVKRFLREAEYGARMSHPDLKPANIMYDPVHQTAKLLDFGIARDAELSPEERLTRAGFFVGTLQYVAPETLSGELVNEQADVYSLATITYHLLTQNLPFTGKSPRELFQQLLTQSPVPLNQAEKGLRFPPAVEA